MKVVIVGCGRVGAALANLLCDDGHEVSVIDKEERSFSRLGKNSKARPVPGVGIDLDVLRQAGIEEADAFAAVTNGDNTNYMASRLAKEEFKVPVVAARLYDPGRLPIFLEAGIATICSTIYGARNLRSVVTGGVIGSHLLLNGLFVAEEVPVHVSDAGKSVSQIAQEKNAVAVAFFRGNEVAPASPDRVVEEGDSLLMVRQREIGGVS